MTKRADGYYWVRETGNVLLNGNRPLVALWENELWHVVSQGEQGSWTDGYFYVLSEKLEAPVERSAFEVIADMAAKQMAETIRQECAKPSEHGIGVFTFKMAPAFIQRLQSAVERAARPESTSLVFELDYQGSKMILRAGRLRAAEDIIVVELEDGA